MPFYFDPHGVLRLREFDDLPWLAHAFSTRAAGDLAEPAERRRFVQAAACNAMPLVTLHQVHSAMVRVAGAMPGDSRGSPLRAGATDLPRHSAPRGDALLAAQPGLLIGIKTADCLPVLLVDRRLRVVAAVHAGWRGIARRIVQKTVGELRRSFDCDPSDLLAAIGPGIQACCFEVGPEVLQEFACQFTDADQFCKSDSPDPALTMLPRQVMSGNHGLMRTLDADRGRIDLAEAVRRQLLAAGVSNAHIHNSGLCTACNLDRFYSYRREKDAAGRMLAVIGVPAGRD
jgi:purine-nucleoside/S-methyl-5'-thioadenosine phosphorylase / adenosine deaminase